MALRRLECEDTVHRRSILAVLGHEIIVVHQD